MDIKDLNGKVELPMSDFLKLINTHDETDRLAQEKHEHIGRVIGEKLGRVNVEVSKVSELLKIIFESEIDIDTYVPEESTIIKIGRFIGEVLESQGIKLTLILVDNSRFEIGKRNKPTQEILINLSNG